MHPVNLLKLVKDTQGNLAKQDIIEKHKDNKDFLFLLKTLLDPFEVTNVKKINLPEPIPRYWSTHQAQFQNLVGYLKSNNRSAKTLKAIDDYLAKVNPFEAKILAGVLTKNYKLGVGGKLVNKALGFPLISNFTLMKAEPFKEELIPWEDGMVYIQEKFDGVRCLVKVENGKCSALTFKGHSLHLPSIFEVVLKFCDIHGLDNIILDGELMHTLSRTKATSAVNKILKNDDSEADDKDLQLKVFYYMSIEEFTTQKCTMTEKEVVSKLSALRAIWDSKHLVFAETYLVRSMLEVDKLFVEVREAGGEGLIFKRISGVYEFKRSRNWVKLKSVYSTTLLVVGTYEGEVGKKYEGLVGGLICSTSCGILFRVGSGLSDDDRVKFTDEDTIVGSYVEVAFTDVGYSDEGDLYLDFARYKADRSFEKSEADSLEKAVGEIPRYKKGK